MPWFSSLELLANPFRQTSYLLVHPLFEPYVRRSPPACVMLSWTLCHCLLVGTYRQDAIKVYIVNVIDFPAKKIAACWPNCRLIRVNFSKFRWNVAVIWSEFWQSVEHLSFSKRLQLIHEKTSGCAKVGTYCRSRQMTHHVVKQEFSQQLVSI